MMKVKLLSANAVMTTGIGNPASSFRVCALNALQNFHDVQATLAEGRADRG
jgi:hypothetical protein